MTDRQPPTRRQFLATLGATSAAGLAGCQEGAESSTDTATPIQSTATESGSGDESLLGYDPSVSHDVSEWDRYDEDWETPTSSALDGDLTTERLVENMDIPWDLSFAGDGTLFITERVGRVLSFADGEVSTITEPADAIHAETGEDSWYVAGGEGGMLGVAAHPGYPEPPLVYVYYTYDENGDVGNRVEVFDASADDPNEARTPIVDGIPGDAYHNGGRITFGPENYLWIATGDALDEELPTDRTSLAGKILRVTPAGDPAPGNPDPGGDADPRIFSYGHRNPQGITWLPDATTLSTEHGPQARDELNRLVADGDYGWPETRDPQEYSDADVRHPIANSGTDTTWAPSGGVFYTGSELPQLQNRMLVGCLRPQNLLVATVTPDGGELPPVDGGRRFDQDWTDSEYVATVQTTFDGELGRIRHVEQGPDGGLYAITSNRDGRADGEFPTEIDDALVRIVAAD